jgi:hypothetical protein
MDPSIARLAELLGRPASDREVIELIGGDASVIERSEHLGYVVRKDLGISIMFAKAPYVLPSSQFSDADALHVSCFHLHREGHEGHAQYAGHIPERICFGDRLDDIVTKLGKPVAIGGGGVSAIVHEAVPRWMRYSFAASILQLELDAEDRMQMISLYLPDPRH